MERAARHNLRWDFTLSVGNVMLDAQHQKLMGVCNELGRYCETAESLPNEEYQRILNDLMDYARLHFETEERILASHGFPALAEHKEEHEKYGEFVAGLCFDALEGRVAHKELWLFLLQWWRNHILTSDMAYKSIFSASTAVI